MTTFSDLGQPKFVKNYFAKSHSDEPPYKNKVVRNVTGFFNKENKDKFTNMDAKDKGKYILYRRANKKDSDSVETGIQKAFFIV